MRWKHWPWQEIALLALLYVGFAVFYMVALNLSFPAEYRGQLNWRLVYVDYPLKALFTLPVWWLTFRVLRRWTLMQKLLLNLLLLPVWVKGWQWSYYWVIDNFYDGGHLEGSAEWWDVYIPGLFYTLQFGIFHAWHYYQGLLRTERARAESDRLALTSELSALKAQLNPHFLYNAFNTISASTGPGQEEARNMIARLSDLFRYQLRANRRDLVPLEEELAFVGDYLKLERERFGERLTFSIRLLPDAGVGRALLPPLLLQPLVENAVRHGISPRVEGGEVVITAEAAADLLRLEIRDNGVGFDPERPSKGYGLANTRRRLDLLYQQPLHCTTATDGSGTRFTFQIPLQYAPQDSSDRRRGPRPQIAAGVPG